MSSTVKIKTLVLDTLSAVANRSYVNDVKGSQSRSHSQWKDEGVALFEFLQTVNDHGGDGIFVVGDPGTGKTFGIRTLNPRTTVWFNVDGKPPTFKGGKKAYIKGRYNYHVPAPKVPITFETLSAYIKKIHAKGKLEDNWYIFILCHSKSIKTHDDGVKYTISLPGRWPSKIHLDGLSNNIYFSYIREDETTEKPTGVLRVVPETASTARSPHELFGDALYIPNDYQKIVEALDNY